MADLQHKERLLRKVKLNNDGTAEVSWKDYYLNPETNTHSHNDVTCPGSTKGEPQMVHDDLKAAFAPFNEHWAIFGEEVAEPKANYPFDGSLKGLAQITVTSVTFSGGEPELDTDEERKPIAVHIQGTYKLRDGRVKNYCLPGIKLGAPQEKYKFSTQVDQHVQVLAVEAFEYVNGKCAPPVQQAMNFDDSAAAKELGEGAKEVEHAELGESK